MRTFVWTVLLASNAISLAQDKKKGAQELPLRAGRLYRVLNVKSGLALDVMDGSNDKGMPLVQATPDAKSVSQHWRVVETNVGCKLLNGLSGMTIDVPSKNLRAGVQLQQYPAHGRSNQQWAIRKVPKGFVIVSLASRQAISIAEGSRGKGAAVVQWPWEGGREQVWWFEAVESP